MIRNRPTDLLAVLLVFSIAAIPALASAGDLPGSLESTFKGKIAVNAKDSVPDWRNPGAAPQGAPNIVLIILDDVGFADTSAFGGPARTPVLDKLAAEGLRYNRFHTAAICSPTRAALLSGRNQHRVGYGSFGGIGYPGYDGIWKKNAVSVAEVLRRGGYSTAALGKWHNTPYQEISPIGPFDRWPTGLGFEYYYGNMMGMSSQYEPQLWRNTQMVAPHSTPEQGYHFTTDITDDAIQWVRTHDSLAAEKPYFLYFATEAAHVPHHVPNEWIDKYRGQFDQGWDKLREQVFARQKKMGVVPPDAVLTPRPEELPAWRSLSPEQKRLLARQMEVFAAFIEHTDHEIGRLLQTVKNGPNADNTLILFITGDNGDEAIGGVNGTDDLLGHFSRADNTVTAQLQRMDQLGGPDHMNIYGSAWAWAGSTPFQWVKHVASHFGGTRNPLVVSWPARIKEGGGIRAQFAYVNDVAPTLYEAAGIKFPEVVDGIQQLPLDGVSLVETFGRPDAPSRHRVQYFEAEGNRAIYQDGWVAAARHSIPWVESTDGSILGPRSSDFSEDRWELYDVEKDFSQARDVAARYPEKLKELQTLFDAEARRNDVYPLGAGTNVRSLTWTQGKRRFVFYPDFPVMSVRQLPSLTVSHRVTADVVLPDARANGAIFVWGGRGGGAVLYVKDGYLVYENNDARNRIRQVLKSAERLPAGKATLVFELDQVKTAGGAVGRLYVNDQPAGETKLSLGSMDFDGVIDIGKNSVSRVSNAYQLPFKFNGVLERVILELK